MNKQIAQGTLAGMTGDHFLMSVEALLETPLECELFKRLEEHVPPDERLCIEDMLDDALYLQNAFTEGGEIREVADRLYASLKELQERLV